MLVERIGWLGRLWNLAKLDEVFLSLVLVTGRRPEPGNGQAIADMITAKNIQWVDQSN